MRASSFPRFLRDGFIRLRRTAAVPGILAPTGLVVLGAWAAFGRCDVTGVLVALCLMVLALLVRLLDMRAAGMRMRASWSLTLIAVMMPRRAALEYIESQAAELNHAGCPKKRRAIIVDTLRASPQTLTKTWTDWLRTQMTRGVVFFVRRRVDHIGHELPKSPPLPVCTSEQRQALLRRWRRLRRYCRLIRFAAGTWHRSDLTKTAYTLASRCQKLAAEVAGRGDQPSVEPAIEAALALQVQQGTRALSTALAEWRPDWEDG